MQYSQQSKGWVDTTHPLAPRLFRVQLFCGVGYQHNFGHKMCADEYPTAT